MTDRAESDTRRAEEDIGRFLYAIENGGMRRWPFWHFLTEGLLDPAWIEELRGLELRDHMVNLREHRQIDVNANRFSLSLLPDTPPPGLPDPLMRLRTLLSVPQISRALLVRFGEVIKGRLRRGEDGFQLRRTLDVIEDRTGYQLRPHADDRAKLVTLLLYLDDEPADLSLGTSLYTPRTPPADEAERFMGSPRHFPHEEFVRVATVAHRANTALCFAPVPNSYHGVEPVDRPGARRFLLQFQVLAHRHDDLIGYTAEPATPVD